MNLIEFLQGDKWLKHPLHPALIAIPIGGWTLSLVMDAIAAVTKSEEAQAAADYTLVGGLVGGGLAATAGITEFMRTQRGSEAEEDAAVHGTLNAAAVTLYAANALIRTYRRSKGRPGGALPKLLSLAGMAAVTYTGWLGGKLAYNHGIGVSLEQAAEEQVQEQERQEAEARASM